MKKTGTLKTINVWFGKGLKHVFSCCLKAQLSSKCLTRIVELLGSFVADGICRTRSQHGTLKGSSDETKAVQPKAKNELK